MAVRMMRLSQVARKLNIGKNSIIEFLDSQGFKIEDNPNFKIDGEQLDLLSKEFADSALDKEEASSLSIGTKHTEDVVIDAESDNILPRGESDEEILIKDNQLEQKEEISFSSEPSTAEKTPENEATSEKPKLKGIKVVGKIDLDKKKSTPKKEEIIILTFQFIVNFRILQILYEETHILKSEKKSMKEVQSLEND